MPPVEERFSFLDPHGHRVAAILTIPNGGTDKISILCHGFLSSKTSSTNNALTRALVSQGIATFRFDFFGQGESEGPFDQITVSMAVEQAHRAVDLMRDRRYRHIGLMGSSFGGLVSILTASQRTDLACLALKCPVVDFAEELRLEFGDEGMTQWKATDTIPNIMGGPDPIKLRYAFYEDCPTRSRTTPLGRSRLQPLLCRAIGTSMSRSIKANSFTKRYGSKNTSSCCPVPIISLRRAMISNE